jgi:hypothetical protein
MTKVKILIGLFIVFTSCKPLHKTNDNYNIPLSNLIYSNKELKSQVISTFNLEQKNAKVFKVLVSRRDKFVRVTIYQLINKDELSEYPSGYFTYHSNTFLCYNGSELIANKRLDSNFMSNIKSKIPSANVNDRKVLQFDVDENKTIKINTPAIDPFDLNDRNIKFPPVNKPIH